MLQLLIVSAILLVLALVAGTSMDLEVAYPILAVLGIASVIVARISPPTEAPQDPLTH
jgi:hypothetical protein